MPPELLELPVRVAPPALDALPPDVPPVALDALPPDAPPVALDALPPDAPPVALDALPPDALPVALDALPPDVPPVALDAAPPDVLPVTPPPAMALSEFGCPPEPGVDASKPLASVLDFVLPHALTHTAVTAASQRARLKNAAESPPLMRHLRLGQARIGSQSCGIQPGLLRSGRFIERILEVAVFHRSRHAGDEFAFHHAGE